MPLTLGRLRVGMGVGGLGEGDVAPFPQGFYNQKNGETHQLYLLEKKFEKSFVIFSEQFNTRVLASATMNE